MKQGSEVISVKSNPIRDDREIYCLKNVDSCVEILIMDGSAKPSEEEHWVFTGAGELQEISTRDRSKTTYCSETGNVDTAFHREHLKPNKLVKSKLGDPAEAPRATSQYWPTTSELQRSLEHCAGYLRSA
ncbi:Nuclear Receptor Corepressor 1, partial [Manis pentadactyla]